MRAPGSLDPVLALLDFLHHFRRSWRCWLIGGPAAVDEIAVGPGQQSSGLRVLGEYQYERQEILWRWMWAPLARLRKQPRAASPAPPETGQFRDAVQEFPVATPAVRTWIPGLARYPVRRHIYRHAWVARSLLPIGEDEPEVRALLAKAVQVGGFYTVASAETAEELCARVRESQLAGPGPLDWVRCVRLETHPPGGAGGHAQLRGWPLYQRLQVHMTHGAVLSVLLGRRWGRFLCFGVERPAVGRLVWPRLIRLGGVVETFLSVALAAFLNAWLMLFRGALPRLDQALSIVLGVLATQCLVHRQALRQVLGNARNFVGRLLRSLGAKPPAIIAIIGPDSRAASLFYSLFLHLASFAALDEPTRGGTVLDATHEVLPALLQPTAAPPLWSATCRLDLRDNGASRKVRLVHVVCPANGTADALCGRILAQAAEIWLVLPAAQVGQAAQLCQAMGEEAFGERVPPLKLIIDTSGNPDGPAQERVGEQTWMVNLSALRDRYLAGGISSDEAAGIVEWLAAPLQNRHTSLGSVRPLQNARALADNEKYLWSAGQNRLLRRGRQ